MSSIAEQVAAQAARAAKSSSFESVDLTKYFTIALPQGVSKGEKTFRMLPPQENQTPFVEVWFHSIRVGGKQRKLYDPGKNEGKPSPLTDVYNQLQSTGDIADKTLSRDYRPRLYYVIKGIEREKEHEGVKFWRFPHDNRGSGIFDSISPIFKKYGDITDAKEGRDLSLTLVKVKSPKGNGEYTAVQAILPNDKSPLSDNEELAKTWIEDTMTWENVYKKYDTEYLLIIAEGNTPMWSEADKKWVAKPDADTMEESGNQSNMAAGVGEPNVPHAPITPPTDTPAVNPAANDISADDLPF